MMINIRKKRLCRVSPAWSTTWLKLWPGEVINAENLDPIGPLKVRFNMKAQTFMKTRTCIERYIYFTERFAIKENVFNGNRFQRNG